MSGLNRLTNQLVSGVSARKEKNRLGLLPNRSVLERILSADIHERHRISYGFNS